MKKVSKAILIGLGVALALVVILLVGLNLYIQSPSSQARIQEELSKALRVPLKLTNTSVTPWSALRVTGITIPNGETNFLEAASFTANYRLLSLLEGKLIFPEIVVESPHMIWAQTPEGKWKLPEPEKAAAIAHEEAPVTTPKTSNPTSEKAPAPKVTEVETAPSAKKRKFNVEIRRFDIKNGTVELLDADKKPVATLTDVNMTYTTLTPEHVAGTMTIGKAIWADTLTFMALRSSFDYSANGFSLPDLTATLGGGPVRGSYERGPERGESPYRAAVQFENVNLDQVVTQSGGKPGDAAGLLTGQAEVHGDANKPDRAAGTGKLDLVGGQFVQLEIIKTIGQIFIRELADLRFETGHAEIRLSGDKVYVDQIRLAARKLEVSGKGYIKLDKKVALDAQLAVDEALVQQLPGKVPDAFTPVENNRRAMDFTITGTTDKLKTNLGDKLIAQTINAQFGNLLQGFMGGGDKKDDAKKKEDEERKKAEKRAEKERKKKEKAAAAAGTPSEPVTPPAPAETPTPAPNL